jgi:uncharacterized protein YeaO (DUF488 family)
VATTTWTADELTRFHEVSERLRAELRASVAKEAAVLVAQAERSAAAERTWAADPDRDDLMAQAKTERSKLDAARDAYDKAVTAAKATRTKKLAEEMAARK